MLLVIRTLPMTYSFQLLLELSILFGTKDDQTDGMLIDYAIFSSIKIMRNICYVVLEYTPVARNPEVHGSNSGRVGYLSLRACSKPFKGLGYAVMSMVLYTIKNP